MFDVLLRQRGYECRICDMILRQRKCESLIIYWNVDFDIACIADFGRGSTHSDSPDGRSCLFMIAQREICRKSGLNSLSILECVIRIEVLCH